MLFKTYFGAKSLKLFSCFNQTLLLILYMQFLFKVQVWLCPHSLRSGPDLVCLVSK